MPFVSDEAYFTLAPDWICEVISPSTGRLDRVKKLPLYARVAIAHGQQVHMRSRPDLHNASSSDSDLYEELLVNPALLTLATQRGNIDSSTPSLRTKW